MSLKKPCNICLVRVSCKQHSKCPDLAHWVDAWKILSRLSWGFYGAIAFILIITEPPIWVLYFTLVSLGILAGCIDIHHFRIDIDYKCNTEWTGTGFPPTRKFH